MLHTENRSFDAILFGTWGLCICQEVL